MYIPGFQTCMFPLLQVIADGQQYSLYDATNLLAEQLQIPDEERLQCRESGVNILYNTVAWAKTYLKHAGLLHYPVRGKMQITDEGVNLLKSGVENIDIKFLDRYPSFIEFKNRKGTRSLPKLNPDGTEDLFAELPDDELSFIPAEKQIWIFAPGPQAKFWDDCCSGSIAVFGTDLLGPLDAYRSKEEIQQALKSAYTRDTEPTNDTRAAWEFSRVMQDGDIIIAKKGTRKIVGVGVVRGTYRHDPQRSEYQNIRDIEWTHIGEWLLPDGMRFALKTLTNITQYKEFAEKILNTVGVDYIPSGTRHFWLNCAPAVWKVSEYPVGAEETYTTHNDKGNKRQVYACFAAAKPGVSGHQSAFDLGRVRAMF